MIKYYWVHQSDRSKPYMPIKIPQQIRIHVNITFSDLFHIPAVWNKKFQQGISLK